MFQHHICLTGYLFHHLESDCVCSVFDAKKSEIRRLYGKARTPEKTVPWHVHPVFNDPQGRYKGVTPILQRSSVAL